MDALIFFCPLHTEVPLKAIEVYMMHNALFIPVCRTEQCDEKRSLWSVQDTVESISI